MRFVRKPAPLASEIRAITIDPGKHVKRVYYGERLVLIVTPSSRRWSYRYTSPITHRANETSIGPWPEYSYSSARQVAAQLAVMVAKGQDPVQEDRRKRAAGTTFAEACEGWIKQHRSKWRSTRHIDTLIKHGNSLADVPIRMIDRPMVIKALSPLYEKHPEQVYRVASVWARVFNYAETMDMREGKNPCTWRGNLDNVFHRPSNGKKHHPSMPFKEVPDLVQRLRLRIKSHSAAAMEFLILTASRASEVLGMKWSEIDLINRVWILPPERTKQNRQHRVPLSERCMEILAVQNEYRTGDFVFTGYKGEALDDKSLRELLKRMDLPIHVTPHGFRASFRNWAARAHINGEHIDRFLVVVRRSLAEMCLGHLVKGKVEAAYWTDDALEDRRPIMDEWAEYCGSAARG
jgi:integrase